MNLSMNEAEFFVAAPIPAGRANNQQWLDHSACARSLLIALHTQQARLLGLTKSIALNGRAFTIDASQSTSAMPWLSWGARMQKGVLQANGTEESEQMVDARQVYDAAVYIGDLHFPQRPECDVDSKQDVFLR